MTSTVRYIEQKELLTEVQSGCIEQYEIDGKFAYRKVILPDGKKVSTKVFVDSNAPEKEDAQSIFDFSSLRLKVKPTSDSIEEISVVDLFCGCGCLSLGAYDACNAIGLKFVSALAIDNDSSALEVYKENFMPMKSYSDNISNLIDGSLGSRPTQNESQLKNGTFDNKPPDLLLAGPPCQGYSSLNNYHRQKDSRNKLYERVTRFVELFSPSNVIIENVPTVVNSPDKVVEKTLHLIKEKGYFVDSQIINLAEIGVPQLRKRHVVIASKKRRISIENIIEKHRVKQKRTFVWAAGDLADEPVNNCLSCPTKHSEENIKRMFFLHHNGKYDLPNSERPKCHQKEHGYKSMYGRIRADEPTQTITSGFTSPGQGRYVHPTRQRTITPHEAARLQLIPDYFNFSKAYSRRSLARMIGNAAPMKLAYVFCLEILS